jgi:hypothetical protein
MPCPPNRALASTGLRFWGLLFFQIIAALNLPRDMPFNVDCVVWFLRSKRDLCLKMICGFAARVGWSTYLMVTPGTFGKLSLNTQGTLMDENKQSPIFSKTSNFLLWLLQHTEKYPKSERFRLAKRIEDSAFNFYEDLIRAAKANDKKHFLLDADLELYKVRLYIRLAHTRRLTDHEQYLFAAESLTEIGNLLGGWLKTLAQN